MAFKEPETLTCPSCGLSGAVTWVVDEGPDGAGGHRYLLQAGPWRNEPQESLPDWRGRLICPTCDVVVRHSPDPGSDSRPHQKEP